MRLKLALAELQRMSHIGCTHAERFACQPELFADMRLRRQICIFGGDFTTIQLLTHSKLPLRNS
jgi:hypothetical protein